MGEREGKHGACLDNIQIEKEKEITREKEGKSRRVVSSFKTTTSSRFSQRERETLRSSSRAQNGAAGSTHKQRVN